MSEKTRRLVVGVVALLIFVICIVLVVTGQRNVGPQGLLTMLLGLAGLIGLLWYYNRQFK